MPRSGRSGSPWQTCLTTSMTTSGAGSARSHGAIATHTRRTRPPRPDPGSMARPAKRAARSERSLVPLGHELHAAQGRLVVVAAFVGALGQLDLLVLHLLVGDGVENVR